MGRLGHRAERDALADRVRHCAALEESERKLRRFVADASHELRTPLAAVRAYAELFARGADTRPDDLARSMRGIEPESERMSVLVDDLLLLARLDEGRPLEREPVELGALVGEAVETAQAVEPGPAGRARDRSAGRARRPRPPASGDRQPARERPRPHAAGAPVQVTLARSSGNARLDGHRLGPGPRAERADARLRALLPRRSSRARASGGAGLGLSIVAAVADGARRLGPRRSTARHGATFRRRASARRWLTASASSGASATLYDCAGKARRLQALAEARGEALLQLVRFSLVGVSNTAISFVAFAALRWADTPAPAAAAFGFIAGALNGYWWNGRWTFAGGGRRRSLIRYGVVQGAGAGLSALIVAAGTSAGLAPFVAFVASMVVVTSTTFVANRSWAFATVAGRDHRKPQRRGVGRALGKRS